MKGSELSRQLQLCLYTIPADGMAKRLLTDDGFLLGSPSCQLSPAIPVRAAGAGLPGGAWGWSFICQQRVRLVCNHGQWMSPLHCGGPVAKRNAELLLPLSPAPLQPPTDSPGGCPQSQGVRRGSTSPAFFLLKGLQRHMQVCQIPPL